MKKWLQRIRGAVGMGLTWAVAWLGVGTILWAVSPLLPFLTVSLGGVALGGFLAGATFSVVLGIAGRRRRFDELSILRFVGWGALGGFLLSTPLMFLQGGSVLIGLANGAILALLGAGSAAGSLGLARRADD